MDGCRERVGKGNGGFVAHDVLGANGVRVASSGVRSFDEGLFIPVFLQRSASLFSTGHRCRVVKTKASDWYSCCCLLRERV